jgi:hypothetical protein
MDEGRARRDISPQAFGFAVREGPQGLEYFYPGPTREETLERLREAGFLDGEDC